MKKGDLKMQAIGLAVAGVLAGSRLLSALPKDAAKGEGKKSSAGDEKPRTRRRPRPTSTSARA